MIVFYMIYRISRKVSWIIRDYFDEIIAVFHLKMNAVSFSKDLRSNGFPIVSVSKKGKMSIGEKFRMNNGKYHNRIGRQQPCYFTVGDKAELVIKNNVAMSATAIVCLKQITIKDNVRIGGNTVIYDTDFHSLQTNIRIAYDEDLSLRINKSITIHENVFIGAHCIILKGVDIGENAIIGSGSVVSTSIPANEIWAGNPAKKIRNVTS